MIAEVFEPKIKALATLAKAQGELDCRWPPSSTICQLEAALTTRPALQEAAES